MAGFVTRCRSAVGSLATGWLNGKTAGYEETFDVDCSDWNSIITTFTHRYIQIRRCSSITQLGIGNWHWHYDTRRGNDNWNYSRCCMNLAFYIAATPHARVVRFAAVVRAPIEVIKSKLFIRCHSLGSKSFRPLCIIIYKYWNSRTQNSIDLLLKRAQFTLISNGWNDDVAHHHAWASM